MKQAYNSVKRMTRAAVSDLQASFKARYGYELDKEVWTVYDPTLTIDLDSELITIKEQSFVPTLKPTDQLANKPNPIGYYKEGDTTQIKFNDGSEFNLPTTAFQTELGATQVTWLATPITYVLDTEEGLITTLGYVGFSSVGNRVLIHVPRSGTYRGKAPFNNVDYARLDNMQFSFTRTLHASLEYYRSKAVKSLSERTLAIADSNGGDQDEDYAPADPEYYMAIVPRTGHDEDSEVLTSVSQHSVELPSGKRLAMQVAEPIMEARGSIVIRTMTADPTRIPSFSEILAQTRAGVAVAPLPVPTVKSPDYGKRSHTLAGRVRRMRLDNTSVVSEDSEMAML